MEQARASLNNLIFNTPPNISPCDDPRATNHRAQCSRRSYRRTRAAQTERPEPEHTHVRKTDAHIPPCVYNAQPITEGNVADGPPVVRAMPKQSALKTERAHVSRTDAHISPGAHNAQSNTERNVADGPTVVRARPNRAL